MLTLKDEINECMANCVDNSGVKEAMRDPHVMAQEILEMTTLDNLPPVEDMSEEDYRRAVIEITYYVMHWQETHR